MSVDEISLAGLGHRVVALWGKDCKYSGLPKWSVANYGSHCGRAPSVGRPSCAGERRRGVLTCAVVTFVAAHQTRLDGIGLYELKEKHN